MLLDTQVWLWWIAQDARLGRTARATISTAAEVLFSAASAWEISIKAALGKLKLPLGADIRAELARDGFEELPIEISHALEVATLAPIHRDPFDRMLVAQARVESLTLMTADEMLSGYDVPTLSALV